MNVLFITRKWPPSVGGMEKYSFELTQELEKLVNLQVVCLKNTSNIQLVNLLIIFNFFIKSFFICLKNRKSIELVHLGDLSLWPVALFCKLINRNLKLIISVHGTDVAYHLRPGFFPGLYKAYLFIASFLIKSSVVLISNSSSTASHAENFGFNKVLVVTLGVRFRLIKKPTSPSKDKYILFVGRIAKRKGLAWFIKNVLPELSKEIRLKVAGVKWDEDEFSALFSSDRIDYLGPVYGDELAKIRSEALVVIMPNINFGGKDFEGFGLTAIEAAADGGVLIASGIDGIVDAVIDGTTGFLLPAGQRQAWVNKIYEISKWSPKQRRNFILSSRSAVQKNFSWELVAKKTFEIYNCN